MLEERFRQTPPPPEGDIDQKEGYNRDDIIAALNIDLDPERLKGGASRQDQLKYAQELNTVKGISLLLTQNPLLVQDQLCGGNRESAAQLIQNAQKKIAIIRDLQLKSPWLRQNPDRQTQPAAPVRVASPARRRMVPDFNEEMGIAPAENIYSESSETKRKILCTTIYRQRLEKYGLTEKQLTSEVKDAIIKYFTDVAMLIDQNEKLGNGPIMPSQFSEKLFPDTSQGNLDIRRQIFQKREEFQNLLVIFSPTELKAALGEFVKKLLKDWHLENGNKHN